MNKLFLMKNPELFQGGKYLSQNKNYFEGWYFKNTSGKNSISFIPGISIDKNGEKAFIQIITNDASYFVEYDIESFKYSFFPFSIQIANNFFSKESITVEIEDKTQNINIHGNLKYLGSENIKTSIMNPNIMGPFSYIPFMECNHAILSMKNSIRGSISINNEKIDFINGIGYIEKDWGCSFPKSYIWCQGNNFKDAKASFMLSIADVPFKALSFKGLISVLIIDQKEYKFTTYNNAKILECNIDENSLNITLKHSDYILNIKSECDNAKKLIAPVKGSMNKEILESITSAISVTLKRKSDVIFNDISINCGLEIVKE